MNNKINNGTCQCSASYHIYTIKNKIAFTLAEVLITLGIIGVVAALTMPALIQNIQDKQLKTAWKKSFSTMSNATAQIYAESGEAYSDGITGDDDTLRNLYTPYLKVLTKCGRFDFKGKCWHKDTDWYQLNGNVIQNDMGGGVVGLTSWTPATEILNDGTMIWYGAYSSCHDVPLGCGYILIDVNGFKKPNTVGRDIYGMHVLKNKLSPFGLNDDIEDSCNKNSSGLGCSVKYLYD